MNLNSKRAVGAVVIRELDRELLKIRELDRVEREEKLVREERLRVVIPCTALLRLFLFRSEGDDALDFKMASSPPSSTSFSSLLWP